MAKRLNLREAELNMKAVIEVRSKTLKFLMQMFAEGYGEKDAHAKEIIKIMAYLRGVEPMEMMKEINENIRQAQEGNT